MFPLFIRICTLFVKSHDDCITLNDVDDIYDEDSVLWRLQKNSLSRGNHRIFTSKFIENTNDNGFVNREGFKITDEAKLHGNAKGMLGKLREYCDSERLSSGKTKRKVGF